ncbi:MAG: DegQ family serine endoprotease [Nitrospirae bacterium]|nr:DegQ family serine endoprotease [Nitrospirota bacterium]MBI5695414.1 DegQ family serine endoprotease [Nitrospirota bacterium]
MSVRNKRLAAIWAVVLVAAGMLIGLAVSSRFDLMNNGIADVKPPALKNAAALGQISDGLAEVAGAVIPSVVNISTSKTVRQENPLSPFFDDPLFRRFFGDPGGQGGGQGNGKYREFKENSLGSGVIVSDDGYIVTNNHVVDGADEIKVTLSDKREFKGKVIGTDPRSDIAVIRIDATGLPATAWADSDKLRPGEMVMAIGSPFGLSQTTTVGIISAVGRANVGITDYEDFIQTDAAINPGNSGGALVNMKAELVGINTAIFSRSGGYQGIGFAVPSNMVRQVMDSLVKTGKVVRGWLGVSVQDLTPEFAKTFGVVGNVGALVADVVKDSPAEKAGLKSGDVITALNGRPVTDSSHLRNTVAQTPVGSGVKVEVVRDRKKLQLEVKVGELPKGAEEVVEGQSVETESALAGVKVQDLAPEMRDKLSVGKDVEGVVVVSVEQGSAAEEAGLVRGDVIQSIDRQQVRDVKEYNRLVSGLGKGDSVLLLINRQGSQLWVIITTAD